MKPANWDQMSDAEKDRSAQDLLKSMRGLYLLAQALHLGIDSLKSVPPPLRENSNLEDMEILQERIFNKFGF